jgi:hypothetical protein
MRADQALTIIHLSPSMAPSSPQKLPVGVPCSHKEKARHETHLLHAKSMTGCWHVRGNATSNSLRASCLVGNNFYSASIVKQSLWRWFANKSCFNKCNGCLVTSCLLNMITSSYMLYKVFDAIRIDKMKIIDHIINKASIWIISSSSGS